MNALLEISVFLGFGTALVLAALVFDLVRNLPFLGRLALWWIVLSIGILLLHAHVGRPLDAGVLLFAAVVSVPTAFVCILPTWFLSMLRSRD